MLPSSPPWSPSSSCTARSSAVEHAAARRRTGLRRGGRAAARPADDRQRGTGAPTADRRVRGRAGGLRGRRPDRARGPQRRRAAAAGLRRRAGDWTWRAWCSWTPTCRRRAGVARHRRSRMARQVKASVRDGRLPRWDRWFDADPLQARAGASCARRCVDEAPEVPWEFLKEQRPVVEWAGACGYVRLSPFYEDAANRAEALGWPVERIELHHLAAATSPSAVAAALQSVVNRLRTPHGAGFLFHRRRERGPVVLHRSTGIARQTRATGHQRQDVLRRVDVPVVRVRQTWHVQCRVERQFGSRQNGRFAGRYHGRWSTLGRLVGQHAAELAHPASDIARQAVANHVLTAGLHRDQVVSRTIRADAV